MARSSLFFVAAILGVLGLIGYFLFSPQILKMLSLALIGLMVLLMAVLLFSGNKVSKLRKTLQELESRLLQESAEELKELYLRAYGAYVKMGEKEKVNFYGRLMKIRERLEESMKAEKELQELVAQETKKKEQYAHAHALYQKLPQTVQQKYYPQLMELKEKAQK